MSVIGTLHQFSFYGLISTVIALAFNKTSIASLRYAATHSKSFQEFFLCYLFWATVLFIPISIIGAFSTKYKDSGEGLSFFSTNILVIAFSHIAEELLGLVCTPFWLLRDILLKTWNPKRL